MRLWFLQQERPSPKELARPIDHYPCSMYRCPTVMQVFLAGFRTGFMLTDADGQPTETLRVMVEAMGAELSRAEDLPPQERRYFTDAKKGVVAPVFQGRWFIRNISLRLRYDQSATGGWGWAWSMFRTSGHPGLGRKRLTETIDGTKQRLWRFVAACAPNWELDDDVYHGLWKWRHDNAHRRFWDSYEYLAAHSSDRQSKGAPTDGHSHMVSA